MGNTYPRTRQDPHVPSQEVESHRASGAFGVHNSPLHGAEMRFNVESERLGIWAEALSPEGADQARHVTQTSK